MNAMNLSESYKKRIQELAGIKSEFIYHGTNDGAAYYIQRSGKMKINAAGNNEPYISFTSDLNVAKYYAGMKGGTSRGVVLRIIRTPDFFLSPKFKKNKGHEWITGREIPLSEIEIQTEEGWVTLEKWDVIDKTIILEDDRELGKSLAEKISSPFVAIFRAAPKDVFEFRDKDYVTLSKKFAIEHAENNHVYHEEPFHVIQAVVPTKNVYDAYNPGEYFFSGEPKKAKEIYITKGPGEYEGLDESNVTESNIQFLSVDEGSIYSDNMEDEDSDNILAQADEITKKSGLHIYSTKDLSDVAYNPEIKEVMGVLYITNMADVFSFDVIVKDEYKRKGIGRKLVDIALDHYKSQKEAYGDDFEMEVEVVNPHMEMLLKHLGFKVTHKLQHGTVLMKR